MTTTRANRDQIISRSHTHIMKEAVAAAGKGSVLSKAEQEKLESNVLSDAAREMRWAGKGAVVSLEPWVDAAVAKVIGAVDKVDKPGKGHGTISRAEAREAVATQGDAGARIGRAWELLTGKSLETGGAASPELIAAVSALVGEKRFGVLAGLGGGEPIAWVQKKIEDTLDGWGGDGLMTQGRIKLDGQTVHVATALTWERKQLVEMIGFFDNDGRALGRAFIERNEDTFALEFRAANPDGSRGAILASVPEAPAAPPRELVAALKAEMQKKYDDGADLGESVGASVLPATLAPMYAFMQRNTPDGVGLERITFEGHTFFAIHDYSCVSSVGVYTPGGEQLFSFVN